MAKFIAFPQPKYCSSCEEEMPWRDEHNTCYRCRVQAENDAMDAADQANADRIEAEALAQETHS